MAERRMFAKTIIDSDAFLDMPLSTQALYFHLSMRADDDGFINNPKKIQRMVGASEDDLKLLILKRFIIPFESGIVVIKHWKIHNFIRTDRYKETVYQEEKAMLLQKDNKAYTLIAAHEPDCIQSGIPSGIPDDNQVVSDRETQVRLGKDRDRLGNTTVSKDTVCPTDVGQIIEKWNELGMTQVQSINAGTKRYDMLKKRIKEYGVEAILSAIDRIRQSSFLMGQNKNSWCITFDWFIKPNNYIKVAEGNYDDKRDGGHAEPHQSPKPNSYNDFMAQLAAMRGE